MTDTESQIRSGTLTDSLSLLELPTRRARIALFPFLHPTLRARAITLFDTAISTTAPAAMRAGTPIVHVLRDVLIELGRLYVEHEQSEVDMGEELGSEREDGAEEHAYGSWDELLQLSDVAKPVFEDDAREENTRKMTGKGKGGRGSKAAQRGDEAPDAPSTKPVRKRFELIVKLALHPSSLAALAQKSSAIHPKKRKPYKKRVHKSKDMNDSDSDETMEDDMDMQGYRKLIEQDTYDDDLEGEGVFKEQLGDDNGTETRDRFPDPERDSDNELLSPSQSATYLPDNDREDDWEDVSPPDFAFPPFPPLTARTTPHFRKGARIALSNISDDHVERPDDTLLELVAQLEETRPIVSGTERKAVISGGMWMYEAIKGVVAQSGDGDMDVDEVVGALEGWLEGEVERIGGLGG